MRLPLRLLPLLMALAAALFVAAAASALTPPPLETVQIESDPGWSNVQATGTTTFVARSPLVTGDPALTAVWNFGDGTPEVAGTPGTTVVSHVFATPGVYDVSVSLLSAGVVVAQGTSSYLVGAPNPPTPGLEPWIDKSVLGLVLHERTIPTRCAGLVSLGSALGSPIRSCTITARVDAALQARLKLPTPVVGAGTSNAGANSDTTVPLVFTAEARAAFVTLRQDIALQLEATVVARDGLVSAPRVISATLGGQATFNDCPIVRPGVVCIPLKGRQANDGAAGEVGGKGWPGITGLRQQVTANDNTGETLAGTYLNDALLGGHGSDVLTGDAGDDVLWGDATKAGSPSSQRDRLTGGEGNDWLYASRGTNTISAGDGRDHIFAIDGKGTVNCGPGKDTVVIKKAKPIKRTRKGAKKAKPPKPAYRLKGCEKVTHP